MRVAMIGTGYVGLVSGACFSEFGVNVACVDKDAGKIDGLKQGQMPIFEPGLDDLVAGNVKAGRLSFSTELAPAVKGADAVFMPSARQPARRRPPIILRLRRGAEIAAAHNSFAVSSPSRPCRWEPGARSRASSARPDPPTSTSSQILNSCAKGRIGDRCTPTGGVGTDSERARGDAAAVPTAVSDRERRSSSRRWKRRTDQVRRQHVLATESRSSTKSPICARNDADVRTWRGRLGGRIGKKVLRGPGYGARC